MKTNTPTISLMDPQFQIQVGITQRVMDTTTLAQKKKKPAIISDTTIDHRLFINKLAPLGNRHSCMNIYIYPRVTTLLNTRLFSTESILHL